MAVDVESKVARLRERLRTSREQSGTLKMRLQSDATDPNLSQPRYMDDDGQYAYTLGSDTRLSRTMLNTILADVLKKSPLESLTDDEATSPGAIPVSKIKDTTPAV